MEDEGGPVQLMPDKDHAFFDEMNQPRLVANMKQKLPRREGHLLPRQGVELGF